jgi:hypothetical protein
MKSKTLCYVLPNQSVSITMPEEMFQQFNHLLTMRMIKIKVESNEKKFNNGEPLIIIEESGNIDFNKFDLTTPALERR